MNKKAKDLKMFKSNFVNPHGLGNVLNVSTAKDMMILCRYAVANDTFRKIMSTKEYHCELYEENLQSIG
jgi:D-alanyl-D-alanine carboxypeptidase (penicillin-binding protein 5/6)